AEAMLRRSTSSPAPKVVSTGEVGNRFLELAMYNSQPLLRGLSGLGLEYRILQIYCRDAGRKEGKLSFSLWKEAKGKGKPRQQVAAGATPIARFLFESAPAVLVRLRVRDHDGTPTT